MKLVVLPKALGVSRLDDNDNAMLVSFPRKLTNQEMAYLHDVLAHRARIVTPNLINESRDTH